MGSVLTAEDLVPGRDCEKKWRYEMDSSGKISEVNAGNLISHEVKFFVVRVLDGRGGTNDFRHRKKETVRRVTSFGKTSCKLPESAFLNEIKKKRRRRRRRRRIPLKQ